jgi:hypothetical protein
LRQNVARFSGLTHSWYKSELGHEERGQEVLLEIDCLRYEIRLQLNPEGIHDKKIEELLDRIPNQVSKDSPSEFEAAMKEMIEETQVLLKDEWEKVKRESEYGDLSNTKKFENRKC